MGDTGSGNSQDAFKLHGNRRYEVLIPFSLYLSTHLNAQALFHRPCHSCETKKLCQHGNSLDCQFP